MCNVAIKREFCGLFRYIFKNCVNCSYEVQFAFIWQVVELANKPISRFWYILGGYPPYGSYLGI